MPPTHICDQLTSPCISIDETGNNVALQNARRAFYGPSSIGPVHETTRTAVTNLLSCLPPDGSPGRVMIVGHGSAGLIITGSGSLVSDSDQMIEVENFARWRTTVRRLGRLRGRLRVSEVTFCSCDTGAGELGAEFLRKVADHIEAIVSGFTGLIFIDNEGTITCETGGRWQHAQPGIDLPEVPAPVHQSGDGVSLSLKYDDKYRTVKMDNVLGGSFRDLMQQGKHELQLDRERLQRLALTINFAEPDEIAGAPLAMHTGILKLDYLIDEEPESRTFLIHNDRLLWDQATPNTFYFASPELAKRLNELRSDSATESR